MIAVGLSNLRDCAASIVYKVGTRSVHIFGIKLPQPTIVKLILADKSHLVGTIVVAIDHIPRLHLARLSIEILKRALTLYIRVQAWVKAGKLLYAAIADIDKRCRIGKVTGILAVGILI